MYKHNPHPGKSDPHSNFQEIMKVGTLWGWEYQFPWETGHFINSNPSKKPPVLPK
jgi:hypothetical protein